MVITEAARRARQHGICALCSCFLILVAASYARQASSAAQSANSKNDYALIYGTVWGADNRPVAGVPVTIRRVTGKKAKWELVSDSRGEFAQRVPAGGQDYLVQADIKVGKGQPKPEITVHIDDNERKDISLHLNK